jgi:hypothetical protein
VKITYRGYTLKGLWFKGHWDQANMRFIGIVESVGNVCVLTSRSEYEDSLKAYLRLLIK